MYGCEKQKARCRNLLFVRYRERSTSTFFINAGLEWVLHHIYFAGP